MNLKNWYIWLIIFLFLESLFPIFLYFAMKNMQALYVVSFSALIAMIFGLLIFIKEKFYKQYLQKEILFPTFMSAFFLWI